MRVRISVVNSGKYMDLDAEYEANDGLATLSFSFDDVDARVYEDDGNNLSGSFTSSRDSGRYKASSNGKRRRTSEVDTSGHRSYKGIWENEKGKRGDFSIKWYNPGSLAPSPLPSAGNRRAVGSMNEIVSVGNDKEPVVLVPDSVVFNDKGRTVMQMFVDELNKKRIPIPWVKGNKVWKSWQDGQDRVRVNGLAPQADRILARWLRPCFASARHVHTADRGYSCKDCNVYSQGGSKGRHQDAQPYGSLVFVFCAGLKCKSSVWLQDGTHTTITMSSGDCMIFEGKTWHEVHECIQGSSPFQEGEWLANRRLSVLVRQKPPM